MNDWFITDLECWECWRSPDRALQLVRVKLARHLVTKEDTLGEACRKLILEQWPEPGSDDNIRVGILAEVFVPLRLWLGGIAQGLLGRVLVKSLHQGLVPCGVFENIVIHGFGYALPAGLVG